MAPARHDARMLATQQQHSSRRDQAADACFFCFLPSCLPIDLATWICTLWCADRVSPARAPVCCWVHVVPCRSGGSGRPRECGCTASPLTVLTHLCTWCLRPSALSLAAATLTGRSWTPAAALWLTSATRCGDYLWVWLADEQQQLPCSGRAACVPHSCHVISKRRVCWAQPIPSKGLAMGGSHS